MLQHEVDYKPVLDETVVGTILCPIPYSQDCMVKTLRAASTFIVHSVFVELRIKTLKMLDKHSYSHNKKTTHKTTSIIRTPIIQKPLLSDHFTSVHADCRSIGNVNYHRAEIFVPGNFITLNFCTFYLYHLAKRQTLFTVYN